MKTEQVMELIHKHLNLILMESEDEETYSPDADDHIALSRLSDSYTRVFAVLEAEKKWRQETNQRMEMFSYMMTEMDKYIKERGIPAVVLQVMTDMGGPQNIHIPSSIQELAHALGARLICRCPSCLPRPQEN